MHPAATLLKGKLEHVAGQHRCRTCGVKPVKCLAKRLPKNPSNFKNYDDLRKHLHSEHAGFSVSNVLNWLSNNAFGASRWVQELSHAVRCMEVCHAASKTNLIVHSCRSTANGSFAAAYQWLVKKREPETSRLQAQLEEVPDSQQVMT